MSYVIYSIALSASLLMSAVSAPVEDDILHLLQLAVPQREDTVEKFRTATSAIRTCDAALQIGQSLNAEIVENRSLPLSNLPPQVRELLRDLPTGRATPVFGTPQTTMKVLVICARKPAQAAANTPT